MGTGMGHKMFFNIPIVKCAPQGRRSEWQKKKTKSKRTSFVFVYVCGGPILGMRERGKDDDYYYIHVESAHRLFVYRPLSSTVYVYLSLAFMFTHSFISHHQMWHSCTYMQTNICQNQPAAIIGCVQRLCLCAY